MMQMESTSTQEGGMIADFPCQAIASGDYGTPLPATAAPAISTPRRQAVRFSEYSQMVAPAENASRPQVRFSPYSQLVVIPKDGVHSKWFSQRDRRQMKHRQLIDAIRMQDLFRNTSPDMVTQDDLFQCVGIEPFLSADLGLQRIERKQAHVEAVLSAQSAHQGDCKKIALASESSSQWARESAERLAKVYATQLKDE